MLKYFLAIHGSRDKICRELKHISASRKFRVLRRQNTTNSTLMKVIMGKENPGARLFHLTLFIHFGFSAKESKDSSEMRSIMHLCACPIARGSLGP